MASGGARSRSGPAPDPNALRRDRPSDAAGWVTLPAAGRDGEAPEWPLSPGASARESDLWVQEWSRPQAVQWERDGSVLEVALYVRRLAEAEDRGAPTNLSTLVKQMMEGLGISQDGLARRRWKIAPAAPVEPAPVSGKTVVNARDRFKKSDGEPGA